MAAVRSFSLPLQLLLPYNYFNYFEVYYPHCSDSTNFTNITIEMIYWFVFLETFSVYVKKNQSGVSIFFYILYRSLRTLVDVDSNLDREAINKLLDGGEEARRGYLAWFD